MTGQGRGRIIAKNQRGWFQAIVGTIEAIMLLAGIPAACRASVIVAQRPGKYTHHAPFNRSQHGAIHLSLMILGIVVDSTGRAAGPTKFLQQDRLVGIGAQLIELPFSIGSIINMNANDIAVVNHPASIRASCQKL
jgi:hypothetical protein